MDERKENEVEEIKQTQAIKESKDSKKGSEKASERDTGGIRQLSSKSEEDAPEEGRFLASLFDWVELFVISLFLVVTVMTFFVRHSPVIGSSMEPTVHGQPTSSFSEGEEAKKGDVMLISNLFYTPKQGDIVVINTGDSTKSYREPIIKRIIGVGGDTVEIYFDQWKTLVNGMELDEPYLYTSYLENGEEKNPNLLDRGSQPMATGALDADGDGYEKIVVPEGSVFVMGDHRNNSKDSRSIGCIDQRSILGKVLVRIYPFDRFGKPE